MPRQRVAGNPAPARSSRGLGGEDSQNELPALLLGHSLRLADPPDLVCIICLVQLPQDAIRAPHSDPIIQGHDGHRLPRREPLVQNLTGSIHYPLTHRPHKV